MKTDLLKSIGSKPVMFGVVALSLTAVGLLPGWVVPDPGSDGEDVEIPDGRLVVNGPVISQSSTLPNHVGDTHIVVAGFDNNVVRSGSAFDSSKGFVFGYSNDFSTGPLSSSFSGLVGTFNDVRAFCSLTVGNSNSVTASATTTTDVARFTNVFGYANTVTGGSYGSFVSGRDHNLNADFSMVVGDDNTLEGATVGSKTTNSLAIGLENHIMADQSWTIGANNEVSSDESLALGTGLNADSIGATFVGEYNAATGGSLTTRASGDPVFVIGNGTSDTVRSTALTVLRDGDIIITKPQGDISMGAFN